MITTLFLKRSKVLMLFLGIGIGMCIVACRNERKQEAIVIQQKLFPVQFGSKWGYIDSSGKYIIKPMYDDAGDFNNELALVSLNGAYGYIDPKGNVKIPINNFSACDFSDSLAFVQNNDGKIKCIDQNGTVKFRLKNVDFVNAFSEGLALFALNGKCGFVNTKGKTVIDTLYTSATDFSEGLAAVEITKTGVDSVVKFWGYVNKKGVRVIPPQYTFVHKFSERRALVNKNNKCGFINTKGKLVIPIIFDAATDFHEGLAAYNQEGLWGIMDSTGKKITEPLFQELSTFSEGLAAAAIGDNNWGYIDKYGNFIISAQFSCASTFRNGVAFVSEKNKLGLIGVDGQYIVKPQFNSVANFLSDQIGFLQYSVHNSVQFFNSIENMASVSQDAPAIEGSALAENEKPYPAEIELENKEPEPVAVVTTPIVNNTPALPAKKDSVQENPVASQLASPFVNPFVVKRDTPIFSILIPTFISKSSDSVLIATPKKEKLIIKDTLIASRHVPAIVATKQVIQTDYFKTQTHKSIPYSFSLAPPPAGIIAQNKDSIKKVVLAVVPSNISKPIASVTKYVIPPKENRSPVKSIGIAGKISGPVLSKSVKPTADFSTQVIPQPQVPANNLFVESQNVYSVQIGAFIGKPFINGVPDLYTIKAGNFTRYLSGHFSTFEAAMQRKFAMIEKGFNGAFVISVQRPQLRIPQGPIAIAALYSFFINSKIPSQKSSIAIQKTYRVQIGAFVRKPVISGVKELSEIRIGTITRYFSGNFSNKESAIKHKNDLVNKGINGAFIVAIQNGCIVQ